jgi:glycosyltransferase involved in cell wall biosynthesis
MKILHLVGTLNLGGIEQLVTQLAIEQKKQGNEVSICCLLKKTGLLMTLVENDGISIFDASTGNSVWYLSHRLSQVLLSWQPDVIHSHVNFSIVGQIMAIHKAGLRVPFIMTQHTIFNKTSVLAKVRSVIMYHLVLNSISKHVAVSSFAAKYAEKIYGIRANSIDVVSNGIRPEPFQFEEESRVKYRREWGVPENDFVWGSVGHLNWNKGYDILIRAFAIVCRECSNCYLVIVGDGTNSDKIRSMCHNLKIEDRVKFLGIRDDVPHLLSAFDAYVQPSRMESAGLSILEALANGLVVVASEIGGIPEVGKYASQYLFLVPSEDENALAQALIVQSKLQTSFERTASKCPENFSFNNMNLSYQKIYREVLS